MSTRYFETMLTSSRIEDMATGGWPSRLMDDVIERWIARQPEAPAVTDRFGTMTWGEFGEEVDAASRGLL